MGNKGIWQTPSAKSLQSLIPYSIRQTLPAKSQTASTASSQLGIPASELIQKLSFSHFSVTIDWTVRENARAQIRVIVKRILRKYGYPPDKQEKATQTVLEQAEVLCKEWVEI